MEKKCEMTKDQKIYPGAADDNYNDSVKAATKELNNNPRSSE